MKREKEVGTIKAIKQQKYMLCFGSYKHYENAVNAKKEFEKMGITCYIKKEANNE